MLLCDVLAITSFSTSSWTYQVSCLKNTFVSQDCFSINWLMKGWSFGVKFPNVSSRGGRAPPLHEKKPFDVIYYLYKTKQFHWLLCVAKNWLIDRATVKPDSSVAPRWMKTYSESRIELRNLQILKKMLEKSSQFWTLKKIPSENLWWRST